MLSITFRIPKVATTMSMLIVVIDIFFAAGRDMNASYRIAGTFVVRIWSLPAFLDSEGDLLEYAHTVSNQGQGKGR